MPIYMDTEQHPYTMGFGMHWECPHPVVGGQISFVDGLLGAYPFLLARDAVITDIAISMIANEGVELGSAAANVYGQVFYRTDTPYFIAIPETKVVLTPVLTGTVTKGQMFEKIVNNLNVPLPAGSRVLFIIHKDIVQQDAAKSLSAFFAGSVYVRST